MPSKKTAAPSSVVLPIQFNESFSPDEDSCVTDYLGAYSSKPGPGAIDRQERGDAGPGEFRYWNPANHATFDPQNWAHVKGKRRAAVVAQYGSLEGAEAAYREQDYQRCEAMNRGDWSPMVRTVTATFGPLSAAAHLGGVESDCGEEYLREIDVNLRQEAAAELERLILARLAVD